MLEVGAFSTFYCFKNLRLVISSFFTSLPWLTVYYQLLILNRADRYGRKRLCITFTITYALSCVTKMFRPIIFLGAGRLLGGFATSILFSVFESWLVSSSKTKGMSTGELGEFLGRCTLVNGIVAATSGVFSDGIVSWSGTFKSPFVASGVLLVAAGMIISRTWAENYGGAHSDIPDEAMPAQPIKRSMDVLKSSELLSTFLFYFQSLLTSSRSSSFLFPDPSLIVVMFVMTCYETSMYLFVFL